MAQLCHEKIQECTQALGLLCYKAGNRKHLSSLDISVFYHLGGPFFSSPLCSTGAALFIARTPREGASFPPGNFIATVLSLEKAMLCKL